MSAAGPSPADPRSGCLRPGVGPVGRIASCPRPSGSWRRVPPSTSGTAKPVRLASSRTVGTGLNLVTYQVG